MPLSGQVDEFQFVFQQLNSFLSVFLVSLFVSAVWWLQVDPGQALR